MESLLDSRPSLQELMKKVCLKAKWYEIGVRLGLDSDELDAINSSPDSPGVKTSRMYKLWLNSNPQATRRELVEVLEDMECNRQAAEYKEYLKQSIEKITPRPEPIPPEGTSTSTPQESTESIILPPRIYMVAFIFIAFLVFIILRSPPPDLHTHTPQVIKLCGSELRDKYIDTLTNQMNSEYPTAGRTSVPVNIPFIPLISIVVKNKSKETAEWLLSTTPKDVVQNKEIMKIQIEDILKPVSEKRLRFVLIEGEPGIGKSTLAKELVLRWANRSDKLLSNYDIVFFIQLRFETYHKATSIEDLFVDLDNQTINMTDLNIEIKKRKGAGILWILDGFDELPSHLRNNSILMTLIKGVILPKSTVIVTSRPVASDLLLELLKDDNSKRISLRGFDSTKIGEFALKYFNDKDKASNFSSYYSDNIVIESMLYNPLNCFIVCTIFNDLIATNNEQYPQTMTSLYNHYIRILLKRHLIKTKLISDIDYKMPQRLMLETDFNNQLLQDVWENFSLISKIAYDGVMEEQYVFENKLHNVTKLSMMDTIFSFFLYEKNESSSFLHTTLQEYFAAVYLVNNKSKFTIKKYKLQENLEVFTFYVGICKMTNKDVNSKVMDILKQDISRHWYTKHVTIGSVLLRCLYEDDSLLYNIGLSVNHSLQLHSDWTSTNFDYYIYGYLIALHKITYIIDFYYSDQIKAFNKGLQSQSLISKGKINLRVSSYSSDNDRRVFKGKINLRVSSYSSDNDRRVFNELLLMPSDPVIKMEISPFNDFNLEICQIISRFKLLEEITVSAAILSTCLSLKENPLKENPLLKLNTLNTNIGYLLHENELKTLEQLIAPGRPLKYWMLL
ncbi:PREDICTED: NACHT, LRR and PYD domains-containing protein 13-like [Amphimedon queenslandica]|uniref:NACHT domain-containing protein n=1 Tax=Amphimedon queenslandica TaxID=400682 RepID=A0A1X7T334_AMPQE|nr:PREDICTED: NACHT, LRR and PYD domains-containing protein 13-like [Amphimedon queenslandica]|eukprot:XP_019861664.1 PREDICTED: NACHT, LRR and PYD domains-containing protein 13-like [Amphimedon queenslandica]